MSSSRSNKEKRHAMKPPKKGGNPKTIKQKMEEKPGGYNPGGPQTPGAKKKRKKSGY